jgi:hypothetical protein
MENLLQHESFRRGVRHALASHGFELADRGRLYVPRERAFVGGVFVTDVNGRDRRVDHNLLPTAALIDLLSVYFKQGTQRTGFYLAPFSGNVAPTAALTGANFTVTQGEFTNYSEPARQTWTPPAAALGAASIDNSAAPSTFTVSVDTQTVWGFGMLTTSVKSDTTGVLVACSKFTAARSGLMTGDKLNAQYSFAATSA